MDSPDDNKVLIWFENNDHLPCHNKVLLCIKDKEEFVACLRTVACVQEVLKWNGSFLSSPYVDWFLLRTSTTWSVLT